MKERILYENEFEQQLKEKADQFKMYPSDKVWNEVHSSLHTRRRRFVAGMSVLIGGILLLAGSQLILPSKTTAPKTSIAKISPEAKPVVEADISQFTAKSFTSSKEPSETGTAKTAARTPYLVAQTSISSSTEINAAIPAKVQSALHIKTATVLTVDGRAVSANEIAGAMENTTRITSQLINKSSTDLLPEKSLTPFSPAHNSRFSWQLYVTPTFNTHTLTGMNPQSLMPSISSAPIMMIHIANVNGFVDNTPAMGYNIGGSFLYRISKNISLKAGLEFGFSRYYVKTYNSNNPQAANVVNSYLGFVNDSLYNANAGMSTLVSKNPQRYQNKYYQLSVPVGIEMKIAGNGRWQLHAGATVQPTYMLNTDAFVLADDYNTYTKDPAAFRRWNLSAGGELFVSYGMGNVRWEIGPQVRYQLLSTYRDSYSLKENMVNYGIRIGISKTIR